MTEKEFKAAVKRYNGIVYDICRDEVAVHSDNKETCNWTLRDMVSEMQYILDIYNDHDCVYYEDAHAPLYEQGSDRPWYRQWISDKGKMERFIKRYEKAALELECYENHCSKYD